MRKALWEWQLLVPPTECHLSHHRQVDKEQRQMALGGPSRVCRDFHLEPKSQSLPGPVPHVIDA